MRCFLSWWRRVSCAADGISTQDLARELKSVSLDPEECYLVRDLYLVREDVRMYFTDGYLIFSKPVEGRGVLALFSADTENGDGEILIFPPTRGERLSLATFTDTPNLSEHIRTALMLFTDDTRRGC